MTSDNVTDLLISYFVQVSTGVAIIQCEIFVVLFGVLQMSYGISPQINAVCMEAALALQIFIFKIDLYMFLRK